MNKYTNLIQLIPAVQSAVQHPAKTDAAVFHVLSAIDDYVQHHREEGLTNYMDQFNQLGLDQYRNRNDIPVETLNGHTVMVLLTYLYREDYHSSGTFKEYMQSGLILRCLERLQDLSETGNPLRKFTEYRFEV